MEKSACQSPACKAGRRRISARRGFVESGAVCAGKKRTTKRTKISDGTKERCFIRPLNKGDTTPALSIPSISLDFVRPPDGLMTRLAEDFLQQIGGSRRGVFADLALLIGQFVEQAVEGFCYDIFVDVERVALGKRDGLVLVGQLPVLPGD